MLPISAGALAALTGACRRPARAEWSTDGRTWTPCGVAAGSATVTADRTANNRYSANATLTGVDLGAAGINPISTNIRLWQGIQPARGDTEWIPAGRYTVASPKLTRTGIQLELDGLEDEVRAAGLPVPRTLGPDTARAIVTELLGEALPGLPVAWRPGVDPDTVIPQIVSASDRWAVLASGTDSSGASTGIAAALAAELYVDARGVPTMGPVPALSDPVVWRIAQGAGVVLPELQMSASGLYNLWIVTGDAGDGSPSAGPVYAWDDDPKSLTYAGPDPVNDPGAPARLGLVAVRVRTQTYSSGLITDAEQAQSVAQARLADSLGVQSTLSLTLACNPALVPGDVVEVEVAPGVWQTHLIDSLSYTLGAASMTCSTRTTTRRLTS
jgi:hypothetical protein